MRTAAAQTRAAAAPVRASSPCPSQGRRSRFVRRPGVVIRFLGRGLRVRRRRVGPPQCRIFLRIRRSRLSRVRPYRRSTTSFCGKTVVLYSSTRVVLRLRLRCLRPEAAVVPPFPVSVRGCARLAQRTRGSSGEFCVLKLFISARRIASSSRRLSSPSLFLG